MEYTLTKMAKYFFQTERNKDAKELLLGDDNTGEVENLLEDIENNPSALIMSFIVDENQIDGSPERLPYEIKKIYGDFDFETLTNIKLNEWITLLTDFNLTKSPEKHAKYIFDFFKLIKEKYESNVKNLWLDKPTSEELINRLLEIEGFNIEKANLYSYILVTKFNIKLADYKNININNDNNILNTMVHIGLIDTPNYELAKDVCKKINPDFPGIFDSFFWMIGEYIIKSKQESQQKMEDDFNLIKYCKDAVLEFKNNN